MPVSQEDNGADDRGYGREDIREQRSNKIGRQELHAAIIGNSCQRVFDDFKLSGLHGHVIDQKGSDYDPGDWKKTEQRTVHHREAGILNGHAICDARDAYGQQGCDNRRPVAFIFNTVRAINRKRMGTSATSAESAKLPKGLTFIVQLMASYLLN